MSRQFVIRLGCLLAGVVSPIAANADQRFHAILTGPQQVPAVSSLARGVGTVTLNAAETEITVNLTFQDLSGAPAAAHIHGSALVGANAGVLFDFSSVMPAATSGTMPPQIYAVTAAQVTALKNRQFYFNIHTAANGGGEIRGQILAAPPERFSTRLTGAQQVPAVTTPGGGIGVVLLNDVENQITVELSFTGLSSEATAAHIHGPGAAGANANVLFDLSGVPAATSGSIPRQSFAITSAQVTQLRAGQFYFNVHTGTNTGGEIRGQIELAPAQLFSAVLHGSQQSPPVSSNAAGTASVLLNRAEDTIYVNLSFAGLTSAAAAAHIHGPAAVGINAAVVFDLSGVTPAATAGSIREQAFAITPAQVAQLKAGLLYFNIHTANFADGEIRGPALLAPSRRITGVLGGSGEVPPVTTTGGGLATVIVNPTQDQISGTATFAALGSNAAAAHIHGPAAATSNAGVIFGFDGVPAATSGSVADQAFAITSAQLADINNGLQYVNVHTSGYPDGEVRAQLATEPMLMVHRAGRGSPAAATTSSPAGIDCGGDCAEAFPASTPVTLSPGAAAEGSVFAGWFGGRCSGTGSCSLTTDSSTMLVIAVYRLSSSTIDFSDDPLTTGTAVKAAHITELRSAANALRAAHGLGTASFTDSTLTAGTTIRAVHISELRAAIGAVYTQRGWPVPTYVDSTLSAGSTIVKAIHIHELRMAVRLLE